MLCVAPQLFRHRQTARVAVGPCRRWRCPACARRLAAQWRAVLELAGAQGEPPTHFITLTLRESLPLWRQAPAAERVEQRQAAVALARCLSRAFSRLVAEIREQFGAFEYMALVELTTGRRTPGHRPHLHLLARSSRRIPRAWLSRRWAFHTRGSRPRVRYSRGYFPGPVAELRAAIRGAESLTSEDGWEYVAPGSPFWQLWWRFARLRARRRPADVAAGGSEANKYREESAYAPANSDTEAAGAPLRAPSAQAEARSRTTISTSGWSRSHCARGSAFRSGRRSMGLPLSKSQRIVP